ncbi:MAG: hypothetical protein QHH24_01760 [Candidatus Bathyarchaeota archaeon]|nr:hypothetical protein [Candidatus Bathyarchaeota archaeon]
MKHKLAKSLAISTIVALLLATFAFHTISASPTPRIYLTPSNIIYTTDNATVGTKFNVTASCEDVPDLGGAQICIIYNDTIVNATRWFLPSTDFFMPQQPAPTTLPTPPDTGYQHLPSGYGVIKIAVSKGGLPPTSPWGHSGKIAVIEFRIRALPTSGKFSTLLNINNIDTFLLDPLASEIPETIKEDGYYEITKVVAPPKTFTLTISATFGGTTDPAPGEHKYTEGDIVTVTAINMSGYIFSQWELDSVNAGSTNPINITMDGNHTLRAVFRAFGNEGDVDKNGIVELTDYLLTALAFGSKEDYGRWDPRCDLDNNGKVDIADIYIVRKNYGKDYRPP